MGTAPLKEASRSLRECAFSSLKAVLTCLKRYLLLQVHSKFDDAAPFFQFDPDGNPVLLGLQTRGAPSCAQRKTPDIGVRLAHLVDFIADKGSDRAKFSTQAEQVFERQAPRDPPSEDDGPRVGAIVGGAIAGLVVVLALCLAAFVLRRKRSGRGVRRAGNKPADDDEES